MTDQVFNPIAVPGHCPACGATQIYLHISTRATSIGCRADDCPDPSLLQDFLDQPREDHHIIEWRDSPNDWVIEHSLRCRVDGHLLDCPITKFLIANPRPPDGPGRYSTGITSDGLATGVSAPVKLP